MATETEYVDAGKAVPFQTLSTSVGKAPPAAKGVNYERILKAREEPNNWLTYYGAYDGQRYSPLDQINTGNVERLRPAWVFQCGSMGMHSGASTYSFETSPLVVDGVMYVTGWDGWVWAVDAKTGNELWRYKRASPYDVSLCCGNVNRGCAVAEGKVFVTTLNAHVIALDAETGQLVWDQPYGDVRAGESATVALSPARTSPYGWSQISCPFVASRAITWAFRVAMKTIPCATAQPRLTLPQHRRTS
jgi:alcohol dehydrogenase (cytochrome c)